MWRCNRIRWADGFAAAAIAVRAGGAAGQSGPCRHARGALVLAYQNNPSLNSQRASVRATDENVPQALSGYRPQISINASGGEQSIGATSKVSTSPNVPATYATLSAVNSPFSTGITVTQTIFNGFQTANRTRQAEALVLAARALLHTNRANGAAQCRHRLYEPAARRRHSRPAAAQRRGCCRSNCGKPAIASMSAK